MNLRTFRASTMADALSEVKRELGAEAVILHTRRYKVGGVLGIGAKPLVEITASGDSSLATRRLPPRRPAVAPSSTPTSAGVATLDEPPPKRPVPRARSLNRLTPEPAASPVSTPEPTYRPAPTAARPVAAVGVGLERELADIKRMVGRVLQSSATSTARAAGAMPDELFSHYLRLMEQEVAVDIADEVIGRVRDELSPHELQDPSIVRETVLRHLAGLVPVADHAPGLVRTQDGRPLTLALVGPTGVGKTTTLAKLAASYKLRAGRKVGLVTTDTYRIAAVDQLRTYADIIGLPLKVATTPQDVRAACDSLASCDVVLIDTAGRSQNDAGRIGELSRFIREADPHETHLVLSSTASQRVLLGSAERFAPLRPNRAIFTKLDEAVNFGVLVGVARQIELKLSYVTTGQEVPEHIERGRPDRLARLILDGGSLR